MFKDFLRMILRFVKTTAGPKMLSRFLLIQTREMTDYDKEQRRRRHFRYLKDNPFRKYQLINQQNEPQPSADTNGDRWYQ